MLVPHLNPRAVDKPTLIERFIRLVPLPYPLAVVFWSLILGSPGFFTVQYFETGTTPFPLDTNNFVTDLLFTLVPLYLFFIVGFMRRRVAAAETRIAPRLSGGEEDFHRVFGRITSSLPVVPLAAVMGTIALPLTFQNLTQGLGLAFYDVVTVYIAAFAFATYVWMFSTASYGIHRLGASSLKLGPYVEERMMGAKPLGNLALSLAVAYFGGLLLLILLFYGNIPTNVPLQAFVVTCLFLGVGLFFLPLNSIHKRMQAEKHRLQGEIGARYTQLSKPVVTDSSPASLEHVRTALTRLTDLQELEILDKKVSSLPTWPFDIQVVSKFITIVLSVTAVLLSRVITGFLHI